MPAVRLMITSTSLARDSLDHFGVQIGLACAGTGDRVADMDVGDGRAGAGCGDAIVRDLLGRDGNLVALADGVAAPGDGAGDEHGTHVGTPWLVEDGRAVARPAEDWPAEIGSATWRRNTRRREYRSSWSA